jgi:REP element-mobilizing transposase RayT
VGMKYHLIWIPKYRKKQLFGNVRKYLDEVFRFKFSAVPVVYDLKKEGKL